MDEGVLLLRKRPPSSAKHHVDVVRLVRYQLYVIGAVARRV
jgi:hypothetical protein